jgi:type VI secretion system protein ImpA
MATPPILDIETLLTPVSEAEPAGPELRSAPERGARNLFLTVRDSRKKAIDAERRVRNFELMTEEERKGEPGAPDPADWEPVRRQAIEALTKSKDLWITAWLIEALTRLQGFPGLRGGVGLAHQLCEKFWQDLHPQADKDEGLATRFAQLGGLDGGGAEGTLVGPIMNLPLTGVTSVGQFSFADYKDASELERKGPEIRRRRIEQGAVSIDVFEKAIAETSPHFFQSLLDELVGASQAFGDFDTFLRQKETENAAAGGQSFLPPTSNIREALDECLRLLRTSAKDKLRKEEAVGGADTTVAPGQAGSRAGQAVETRQEAFQTLSRVSEYFRRAEPHSPISYALEQVVRWGHMSLPELLSEIVADKSARDEIFRRAGIPQDKEP